jgi:hypothetical protein
MEKNVYHITEKDQYMPPSSMDLITIADTIGTKLMNVYNQMGNIKSVYPGSADKIDAFINSSIIPLNDKIKALILTEIPELEKLSNSVYKGDKGTYRDLGYKVSTVKEKAIVDMLLKIKGLDKNAAEIQKKAEEIKSSMNKEYQGSTAAKSFEDSAQAIIDKVRKGIEDQAEQNIRDKKRGDVIPGTTDVNDMSASRAAGTAGTSGTSGASKSTASSARKRKNIQDISDYLAKKYQTR